MQLHELLLHVHCRKNILDQGVNVPAPSKLPFLLYWLLADKAVLGDQRELGYTHLAVCVPTGQAVGLGYKFQTNWTY